MKFFKAQGRVAQPEYYRKKYDFWWKKLIALMDQAGRNLDVQPATEPKELTLKITDAEAKMLYYSRMIPVAHKVHKV